jgi:hypothetical protein
VRRFVVVVVVVVVVVEVVVVVFVLNFVFVTSDFQGEEPKGGV